jgi:tripartite-type tricarboxylate transporter receptor subunit TctC
MPRLLRRALAAIAAATLLVASPAAAFPDGAVTLVVGFAAGGPTDGLARILAERMAPRLGQAVTVENIPGAGATRAADRVAKAPADGHVLGLVASSHAVMPGLFARLPYHPIADFAPIGFVGDGASILVAHRGLLAGDLAQLVALGRAAPTPLVLAAAAPGGFQPAAEMLRTEAALPFERVPYRSVALALRDVMEGRAQLMFANVVDVLGAVGERRLHAIGATSPARSALLPAVPSFVELGYADFHSDNWFGMLAPRDTPEVVAARLHAVLGEVLADPAAQAAMRRLGVEARAMPRLEWGAFLQRETARWTATARASGARVE